MPIDAGSPARLAWGIVALLCLAYIVSFVDRTILSLLVEPIRADLGLSDTDIALVGGLAFGIFYSVMGLPLGWLVDRFDRRRIVAAGLLAWSAATIACGLVGNFGQLFAARMLIGIGEATLAPAALSMIADLFEPRRRPLAVAVFVTAGSIGGGAAMILGGWLVGWTTEAAGVAWPVLGVLAPWRKVFVAVGSPGIVLAAAMLVIREPSRHIMSGASDRGAAFFPFLRANRAVIAPLIAAMTALSVIAYGYLAWLPTHFIRAFGWSAVEVGTRFGLVFLICGTGGALIGGAVAARSRARHGATGNLRVVVIGLGLLVVPATVAPLQSNGWVALAWFAPVMALFAYPSGAAAAALQDLAPGHLRGRVIALYYAVMNLVGLSTGALSIAKLAGAAFSGHAALGEAMAALAPPLLLLGFLLAILSLRASSARGRGPSQAACSS